jgi:uracil-DNA glycosylase family 4
MTADVGDDLARFWRDAMRCRECPSIAPWRKFPPGARGSPRYGLMILGEAPGRVSLENGRPFSNPRNLTVRNAAALVLAPPTIVEEIFYFSDAVKCWPASASGANRSPSAAETATCIRRHLAREIAIIRPRVVFAFGVRAASAALGRAIKIAEVHGTTLEAPTGYRVIPLMHPSTINIAGMHRVGIQTLGDYALQLAEIFRHELRAVAPHLEAAAI